MGLAGPKNRTKISADPNNTTWSKSTDRFGHKILLKQGWTPGSYLGAKDAKHASHYTAANASHIRVAVKDDNLGLGAKRGKAENETFGLTAFQGLLGRLNGKSDGELKKEESTARDLHLRLYQNQRWGSVRFVSGGLLVGDKIEQLNETENPAYGLPIKSSSTESESAEAEHSEKKRKRTEEEDAPKLKKKKTKSDLKRDSGGSSQEDSEAPAKKKKSSKSKKAKKSKDEEPSTSNAASSTGSAEEQEDRDKLDKKARREAKKALRAARIAKKETKKSEKEKRRQKDRKDPDSEGSSSDDEAPPSKATSTSASGTTTPSHNFAGGRLAVRQRYIAQKKKASMDPQALKEIFMIKAEA
ncbi:hypothetical protein B0J12DRAFT_237912 [Macrophomina phaseolina]|uniref:PinX1-related protein 1 n=1 Tax=Macrophomina phaseolina TaxID=35725 RepID=A0ABQ8GQZ9_9PEZI|nr:hypothetical protein B0J12DRAFT_237912 [Macrophomina phaseolina]